MFITEDGESDISAQKRVPNSNLERLRKASWEN